MDTGSRFVTIAVSDWWITVGPTWRGATHYASVAGFVGQVPGARGQSAADVAELAIAQLRHPDGPVVPCGTSPRSFIRIAADIEPTHSDRDGVLLADREDERRSQGQSLVSRWARWNRGEHPAAGEFGACKQGERVRSTASPLLVVGPDFPDQRQVSRAEVQLPPIGGGCKLTPGNRNQQRCMTLSTGVG